MSAPAVVLASQSAGRRALLEAAGVAFTVDPAHVDEDAFRQSLRAEGADAEIAAEGLAELKAVRVSNRHEGALVVGADQILDLDGEWFDKAPDLETARAQLQRLRGCRHRLATAVVVARDGARLWHHVAAPSLHVRAFSDAFLDDYVAAEGEALLGTVGAYRIEGRGVQLFDRIEGDSFAIVGLPLLPLLEFLRGHGVVGR